MAVEAEVDISIDGNLLIDEFKVIVQIIIATLGDGRSLCGIPGLPGLRVCIRAIDAVVCVFRRSGGSLKNQIAVAVLCQLKVFTGIGELVRVAGNALDDRFAGLGRILQGHGNDASIVRLSVLRGEELVFHRSKLHGGNRGRTAQVEGIVRAVDDPVRAAACNAEDNVFMIVSLRGRQFDIRRRAGGGTAGHVQRAIVEGDSRAGGAFNGAAGDIQSAGVTLVGRAGRNAGNRAAI